MHEKNLVFYYFHQFDWITKVIVFLLMRCYDEHFDSEEESVSILNFIWNI